MLSDPIVALATPAGRSALAIVRLSGDDAFAIARRVVSDFQPDPPRHARLASFRAADGTVLDQGLYTAYPGPASYTGEDLVEFSCHGGFVAPAGVLAALQAAGARLAFPGEFTRRAVLNGKMDLLQAEAVGDLIDASAPAQARSALNQLDGGLSRRLDSLRSSLINLEALLSYSIDFPEEDDGPIPLERIIGALKLAQEQVAHLLRTAPAGQKLREGALVVIAGRPNAGKSSLFNALLGTNRVLVSEVPGTTRDAVEAFTDFNGWPVRLMDTAGLGDFEHAVDRLGVTVSHRYIAAADLVFLCVDAAREPDAIEREMLDHRTLFLRTRSDLARPSDGGIPVSSVTGEGLEEIRRVCVERVFSQGLSGGDLEPVLTRERHRDRLAQALIALNQATEELGGESDAVLVSHHVRQAIGALDELIGSVDIETVLDQVFSSFCIGK